MIQHNAKLAFVASPTPEAQQALSALTAIHGNIDVRDADLIIALGGDGFMLQTLHRYDALRKPFFGMKLGTVGFLMNHQEIEGLPERLTQAEKAILKPLEMIAQTESGSETRSLAYNEVSLLRQTRQAAHIAIELNGRERLEELICDGVLVASPAGSTAYNFSAGGPILPLDSQILALTPIAPFRPRRWRGAVLRSDTLVKFRVLDPYKRPVSATADSNEVRNILEVQIREASGEPGVTLLFDRGHNLEERVLAEQFSSG